MRLKDHLKLFLADTLVQILGYGSEGFVYKLLNLDTRQRHIFRERRKMTRTLWFSILMRDQWRCQRCGIANWRNQSRFLPKLEVDHIQALYNGGRTERFNLQALCKPCNQKKGVS